MWSAFLLTLWRNPRLYAVLGLLSLAIAFVAEAPITGRSRMAVLALFALGAITL